MGVKYGHGYTGAAHMTKVFVKNNFLLFSLCISRPCYDNESLTVTGLFADRDTCEQLCIWLLRKRSVHVQLVKRVRY